MSNVKIPLNWYIDVIQLDEDRFLLFEWFEDEKCKNQTLICLGKYIRITLGELRIDNKGLSNKELSFKKLNNEVLGLKHKQIVKKNPYYEPYCYFLAKEYNLFGGE